MGVEGRKDLWWVCCGIVCAGVMNAESWWEEYESCWRVGSWKGFAERVVLVGC
jgi:hypothetical protein